MSELDQLRQEAEQLKNQIRVSEIKTGNGTEIHATYVFHVAPSLLLTVMVLPHLRLRTRLRFPV